MSFYDNKPHQLCFNGQHQHQYLFEYITRYIDSITENPKSKPLFSYTSSHVSHDQFGVRVQTLDNDLKNFIDVMSSKQNTVTIIFADHGNTYTAYQGKMLEGRQEMYHPMMLLIVPKQLGKKFGKQVMLNLKTNQHRLFSMLDFRAGLVALAKYDGRSTLNAAGIFSNISKTRTCDDLVLTKGVICLCQIQNAIVIKSSYQFAIAEFAIGQLNNQIQESLLSSKKYQKLPSQLPILFGSCQRLRIQNIFNVLHYSRPGGVMVTNMDVKIQSGTMVDQEELITVQVESQMEGDSVSSLKMKLVSSNRISKYGPHKACADPDVSLKLCVCNKKTALISNGSIQDTVGPKSKIKNLKRCVIEVERKYEDVSVYEIANICNDRGFNITFNNNSNSSVDLPIVLILQPRTVYFVASRWLLQGNIGRLHWKVKMEGKNKLKNNKWRGGS